MRSVLFRASPAVVALLALAALAAIAVAPARAQSRPAFFDQPSEVRAFGTVPAGQRVPLLVLLPPTGGTADGALPEDVARAIGLRAHFRMLTPGAPSTRDYLPGFSRYVDWAAARVLPDVEAALAAHPIDPQRVFLVGFSVGGDTAWAVLARHPGPFRGALVMGARSSAALRAPAAATLRSNAARLAFTMGDDDDAVRRQGIRRAYDAARAASLPAELYGHPGGHVPPPADVLRRAFAFLLGDGFVGPPSAAAPASNARAPELVPGIAGALPPWGPSKPLRLVPLGPPAR